MERRSADSANQARSRGCMTGATIALRSAPAPPSCSSKKIPTDLLAATTCLRAQLAVRVGVGMSLALVAAERADCNAGLEQRLADPRIIRRRAARDASGGRADIG